MPSVSVLIPSLNASKTIRAAICTTLRSLPRDSEVIIINDGSTDNTSEIVSGIMKSDRRVRLIESSTSVGISQSLNFGLKSSDSLFVARLDADDVTLPGRFFIQKNHLESQKLDFAFTTAIVFGDEFRVMKPKYITPRLAPFLLSVYNPFIHSTLFCRRKSIDSLGGYNDVLSEDYDLWLRAATHKLAIARHPIPTVLYRRHGGQISQNEDWINATSKNRPLNKSHDNLQISLGIEAPNILATLRSLELKEEDSQKLNEYAGLLLDVASGLNKHEYRYLKSVIHHRLESRLRGAIHA